MVPLMVERLRFFVACAVALLPFVLKILFLVLFTTKKCKLPDSSFPSWLLHFNKHVHIFIILSKKPKGTCNKEL